MQESYSEGIVVHTDPESYGDEEKYSGKAQRNQMHVSNTVKCTCTQCTRVVKCSCERVVFVSHGKPCGLTICPRCFPAN